LNLDRMIITHLLILNHEVQEEHEE
jgi:hypothetical protein